MLSQAFARGRPPDVRERTVDVRSEASESAFPSEEIAFTAAGTGRADLFVVNVALGSTRRLSDSPGFEYRPHWSPDGTNIVAGLTRGLALVTPEGHYKYVEVAETPEANVD